MLIPSGEIIMAFMLLQKICILETAEEYSDIHRETGIIVQMNQTPDCSLPFICVQLTDGRIVEDLLPDDIEAFPQ